MENRNISSQMRETSEKQDQDSIEQWLIPHEIEMVKKCGFGINESTKCIMRFTEYGDPMYTITNKPSTPNKTDEKNTVSTHREIKGNSLSEIENEIRLLSDAEFLHQLNTARRSAGRQGLILLGALDTPEQRKFYEEMLINLIRERYPLAKEAKPVVNEELKDINEINIDSSQRVYRKP